MEDRKPKTPIFLHLAATPSKMEMMIMTEEINLIWSKLRVLNTNITLKSMGRKKVNSRRMEMVEKEPIILGFLRKIISFWNKIVLKKKVGLIKEKNMGKNLKMSGLKHHLRLKSENNKYLYDCVLKILRKLFYFFHNTS